MTRRNVLLAFALGAVGALLGGLTVAWADHQFSDVPDSHSFHEQIGSVVDAGCATGFNDGTFRPGNSPTRGQFAYWMNNCGGRAQWDGSLSSFLNDGDDDREFLAPTSVTAGAQGDGVGLVVVIGTGTIDASADGNVEWSLHADDGTSVDQLAEKNDAIYASPGATINPASTVTLLSAVEIDAGETIDFFMNVHRADGIPLANIHADVVAMYFPFNGDGGAGFPAN
jgi:hypothetical protein